MSRHFEPTRWSIVLASGESEEPASREADSWPGRYTPQTFAGAVEKAQTLRDVASKRAEKFFVVIIPTLDEASVEGRVNCPPNGRRM